MVINITLTQPVLVACLIALALVLLYKLAQKSGHLDFRFLRERSRKKTLEKDEAHLICGDNPNAPTPEPTENIEAKEAA